jgi:hypothetical protein
MEDRCRRGQNDHIYVGGWCSTLNPPHVLIVLARGSHGERDTISIKRIELQLKKLDDINTPCTTANMCCFRQ